jgi:hypothetical protein
MISIKEYHDKREKALRSFCGTACHEPLALEKTTSNLFRHRQQERVHRLDLRHFNQVLRVDEKEACAEVEGLTTYEELVRET